ncbi:MAG: hypothetical protein Q8O56_11655, partial [Solirubrobacteraceae bacterium]|nr:hypothetical protein [Solirubrobacteraceae bacterium]
MSLVAAAALSLLAVSAVFAFGGWSDPVAESVRQSALVIGADDAQARTAERAPIVLAPRPSAPARRASPPARSAPP